MIVGFLMEWFAARAGDVAIVWKDAPYSYDWLGERMRHWQRRIDKDGLQHGSVVALEADFSPEAIALWLALVEHGAIVVPMTTAVTDKREEFLEIAQVEIGYRIDGNDAVAVRRFDHRADHPHYCKLRESGHAGLVLFSSGSTGKSKAAVHDLVPLLEKFNTPGKQLRTISFLLYDHIGGVNTMLYTLSGGGSIVTVDARTPDGVLRAVDRHRVELLPTTPTFLNMILLSEAYRRYDLRSLKIITYGTEPMSESTLKRLHEVMPEVRLQQTYGLSEIGIMQSRSKTSDSLWVKVGGRGFQTRVVDGMLQIKARSAMLGYLNAPSPFTEDGWLATGDCVEQDGEYVRFLGRKSELINVGGQKVYPAEVEDVIGRMDNVAEVTVHGEPNPILGRIVCAKVTLRRDEPADELVRRLKRFCREHLEPYKVPVKVLLADDELHSPRFKKTRAST